MASDRLSHLLSQLLMTARIDSSPAFTKIENVDAAELTRQSLAGLVPKARQKGVSVSFEGPESACVLANSLGLRAIVDNIVDNAVRYTPSGGKVHIALERKAAVVELCVKDDGPGIAPEHHAAVFERFYRIPGNEEEGSGLGLSIVRRLVVAYGGRVQLGRGFEGRGLCVALTLSSPLPCA
jgi:signal transduction histidine kinase